MKSSSIFTITPGLKKLGRCLLMVSVPLTILAACEEGQDGSLSEDDSLSIVEGKSALSSEALAVITTNALAGNSQSLVGAYVAQRRQTRPVYLVTEDTTNSSNGVTVSGGWANGINLNQAPSLASSSQRADAIHDWLKSNYSSLGIGDVLLIGDPNPNGGTLPMKNMYPYKSHAEVGKINPDIWNSVKWTCLPQTPEPSAYEDCQGWMDQRQEGQALPTDYYYSNLTYVWPLDADGDIVIIADTDFSRQDVNVGRLPVYNNDITSMNKILSKFIAYSTSTDTAWRKNALLPMGTHFADLPHAGDFVATGEAAKNRIMIPNGFDYYRIYPTYYNPDVDNCKEYSCMLTLGELNPLSLVNVGSVWAGSAWSGCQGAICNSPKKNFGVVFWAAHGGNTGAENIIETNNPTYDYTGSLDDLHPAFTVSVSCNNSNPYASNNLGTTLLKNGAIAVLGASRVSWPGGGDWANPYVHTPASTDVGFGFVTELVDSKLPGGEALSTVRTRLWDDVLASMPVPDRTLDNSSFNAWNDLTWWKAQLLLFNLYGDPTIGLEAASTNPSVISLAPNSPKIVDVTPAAPVTFYADNWPSKGNPWWTANVVIALTTVDGHPIPSGTVWVNGVAYTIGGSYYQVLNVPDTGPYTIQISPSSASRMQVTLQNQ